MSKKRAQVVEGIEHHLERYLTATRSLTAALDQENQLLMFESGEMEILQDAGRQHTKQALYARVETLGRIVVHTLQTGSAEDVATIRASSMPIENFRRSLRLNSVLLEVCMERQERRMARIMQCIETTPIQTTAENAETTTNGESHVAERSPQ